MRLLRIVQDVPYPVRDGSRAEPFELTRCLAELGHDTTIVALQREPQTEDPSCMDRFCELHVIPFLRRNSIPNLALGVLEGFPINYVKYRDPALLAKCFELLGNRQYDAVVVDHSALGWHALQIRKRFSIPIITRWHNLDTLIWERWTASQKNLAKRAVGRYQVRLISRFEQKLAMASDLCLVMGSKDAELLRKLAPGARIEYLPLGVNTEHYAPGSAQEEPSSLVFLASRYDWHPNWDAVNWLYQEIMPRIWQQVPAAKLYITGTNIQPAMQSWTRTGQVVLTGFVPDERTVIANASVLVVPMRLGGGIKLKVLTALAMGKAVITTSQGAEGISGLVDGEHVVIRDTPQEFAEAAVEVMQKEQFRKDLGRRGREFVCQSYDWRVLAEQWERILSRMTKSGINFKGVCDSTVIAH